MNAALTIVYITSRREPKVNWFTSSVAKQLRNGDNIRGIVVDGLWDSRPNKYKSEAVTHVAPKPTVWQGKSRVTKQDWWAASNARNTGIALCDTEWICFLDDRSVLLPGWLDGIRRAQTGRYVACGAYMKFADIQVVAGTLNGQGALIGVDSRLEYIQKFNPGETLVDAPGEWTYGCCIALPLEWALEVNGFDETCDGASHEDSMFGLMLANNGYPIKYDASMVMIEDRTPGCCDPVMRREDKGVSPNDKSHYLLNTLRDKKRAQHPIDLRAIRKQVLSGGEFPPAWGPERDPFDGQLISQM